MKKSAQETYRIIDASVNRIGEGLRVLEEFARMTLDDKDLTQRLKDLRHTAVVFPTDQQIAWLHARDSQADVGSGMNVTVDVPPQGVTETVIANSRRAQESLRVLEELAKLPDSGFDPEVYRRARFSLYTIEKDLLMKLGRREKLEKLNGLYVIIDAAFFHDRDPAELTRAVVRGGARVIQYRDKEHGIREMLNIGSSIRDVCRETGTLFIVNDSLETALAIGADGLHVGQDDMPVDVARGLLPSDRILGCSVRTVADARRARDLGADHLGVGAMYATSTKEEASVIGPTRLEEISQSVDMPLVAIGGINRDTIGEIIRAGASAVCVISAVLGADDVELATRQLVDEIEEVRT